MVAANVEPIVGSLVGAISTAASTLHLWSADGRVPIGESDGLIIYRADGSTVREKLRTAASVAIREIPPRGVDAGLLPALARSVGVGLETTHRPSVLVPAPNATDDAALAALAWGDAARGFPLLLAQRLETEWGAPIASMHLGNPSVFHFLKGADHAEISVGVNVERKSGRSSVYVGAASAAQRGERLFRARLGKASSYPALVARISKWIASALVDHHPERDELALIA